MYADYSVNVSDLWNTLINSLGLMLRKRGIGSVIGLLPIKYQKLVQIFHILNGTFVKSIFIKICF